MQTEFDLVGDFHERFGLPVSRDRLGGPPGLVDERTFLFRYDFLLEEMHELLRAYRSGDLPGVADALADLVYVALGTAHFLRIPFNEVFAEVQRANMTKVRASGDGDERSKRGSNLDVVKPAGWTPPDVDGVLRGVGWEGSDVEQG